MSSFFNNDQPAILLGVADFFESSGSAYPAGDVDLFRLSKHKMHIIYPGLIQSNVWVFLVYTEFIKGQNFLKWKLRIADENDAELGKIEFSDLPPIDEVESQSQPDNRDLVLSVDPEGQFSLIHFKMDATVPKPGKYTVYSDYEGMVPPSAQSTFTIKKLQL